MKLFIYLFPFLLSISLLAQTNYVATTPLSATPGEYNTIVGPGSGNAAMTGKNNTFLGVNAGINNTTGNNNTFLGAYAGQTNSAYNNNSFIGFYSGSQNSTGYYNTFLGASSGYFNSGGYQNTFIGMGAGFGNKTGFDNTYLGFFAGQITDNGSGGGIQNTFVGSQAGHTTSGSNNVFMGARAGYTNTSGQANVFIGSLTGSANTTGQNNTFLGYQAGYNATTGSNNIIIGPNSGTAITDGSENVLMGYNSQAEDGLHNATAIGAGSRVAVSDALILGNQANVGIGTSAPTARLELVSDKPNDSGLRLTNLTTISPTTHSTDQFLTVNEKGEVIKARYQLRISDPSQWSDKVFSPFYVLKPLSFVASYIGQHRHLPGVPSAQEVAQEGVDLMKMNAILLAKVEELTLYSIQLEKADQNKQQELKHLKTEVNELKYLVKQLLEKK